MEVFCCRLGGEVVPKPPTTTVPELKEEDDSDLISVLGVVRLETTGSETGFRDPSIPTKNSLPYCIPQEEHYPNTNGVFYVRWVKLN